MLVGIDLFVRRCIEGVQVARAVAPVTYPPQLTWRQPPKRLGVGACSGFGRSRSERVFRNEFPYLGRAGLAAWAGFRPVSGNGIDRHIAGARRESPNSGARCAQGCAKGQGPEGSAESRSRSTRAGRPAGSAASRWGPAAGSGWAAPGPAGPADLCAVDEILPEGPGRQ